MSVSFSSIPVLIREPGFYAEFASGASGNRASVFPRRGLMIGQRLSTGTVAECVPTRILSDDEADTSFGLGSPLAEMCRAYRAANSYTELWAIGLDDAAGGTQGTQIVTVTGPATASGSACLWIGGRRYAAAVSVDDTAIEVAAALHALIDADDHCPMTSAIQANPNEHKLTLTARNDGTQGNTIDVRVSYGDGEALPAGIAISVAADVTGAGDPDLGDAIAVMEATRYSTIACSLNDDTNLSLLETELDTRWGPTVKLDGLAVVAFDGSLGDATTYGNARNSEHTIVLPLAGSPTPSWEVAAALAGVIDAKQNVAQPHNNLEVVGLLAPAPADRWIWSERNIALTDGLSTYHVASDGTCYLSRLITTYQTAPSGAADTSYLDAMTVEILSYLRYDLDARVSLKFPNFSLAEDGARVAAGLSVLTPSSFKADVIAWLRAKEDDGIIYGVDDMIEDIIVEINSSDPNRLDVQLGPSLMKALHVVAAKIAFE
jgi:phage tail sheath gpL-like